MNYDASDAESHDAKSVNSENAVREPTSVHNKKRSETKTATTLHDQSVQSQTSQNSSRGVTFGFGDADDGDEIPSPDSFASTNRSGTGGVSVATATSTSSHHPRSVSELPSGSRLSLSAYDATLPMAYDNERFFDVNEGYYGLLQQAYVAMADLSATGTAWDEPNAECGSFLGLLWRWFWLRVLFRLTDNAVNRLLLTRGIQDYLAFTTAYESFVLGGVIRELDSPNGGKNNPDATSFYLRLVLWNRNTCRILVRTMRHERWDWCYHLYTQVTWNRLFYTLGMFPFLGWMGFTPTENYPAHHNFGTLGLRHYMRDCMEWCLRRVFFWKRDPYSIDPHNVAANLASDSAYRAHVNRDHYGTYFGRQRTTRFRLEHRLTIDESIIRTFMSSPETTLIDNGVEHVLRCLNNHWANMLYQENGNFAHQRMEQLNPFEILRFYMPIVLTVLANLRGRNYWDAKVLGPFIKKLQHIDPSRYHVKGLDEQRESEQGTSTSNTDIVGPCKAGMALVQELRLKIVRDVCAGIPSRMEPLDSWLVSIVDAFAVLQNEAEALSDFIATVESGISLGSQLLKLVRWSVPSERSLRKAVIEYILNNKAAFDADVDRNVIISALEKLSPKDERTLKELVFKRMQDLPAARLLLNRTTTLLEREIRRRALDQRIRGLAMGQQIDMDLLERSKWYWIDLGRGFPVVAMLSKWSPDFAKYTFEEIETNSTTMLDAQSVECFEYIPVAEAISRAQKAFMTTEVEHCKRFSYYCFMELGSPTSSMSLRTRLRRLATLAQVQCSELDGARLNTLTEIKNSVKKAKKTKLGESRFISECRPQNTIIVGGGPTGLLAAIHCLHNIILSGGTLKIYEGRDAFDQEASSFERAQIVRLDSRQISMLRYHLGTGFEDVFIPAKGETNAHLGNVIPNQGFVEVTIKRLESMLLDEVVNLRSKDLLLYYSESKISHNAVAGTFEKIGRYLKIDDIVRDIRDGRQLKVVGFSYESRLSSADLVEGNIYDVVLTRVKTVCQYRLEAIDRSYDWYRFTSTENARELCGSFDQLPPIYYHGAGRIDPSQILVEVNGSKHDTLSFDRFADYAYELDVTNSHAVIAIGKPSSSPMHFAVTTSEPYAICCIEGMKVSMGMHKFGEKRWGAGLTDDVRSQAYPNTRIVGDFTKSVKVAAIVVTMKKKLSNDSSWYTLLELSDRRMSELLDNLMQLDFHRQHLQTRFFELGNNYYLGMEMCREFDVWKRATVGELLESLHESSSEKTRKHFRGEVSNMVDRLWYEATLAVLESAAVYIPGSRSMVPQLNTLESPVEVRLRDLKQFEAFRLVSFKAEVVEHKEESVTSVKMADATHTRICSISSQVYVLDHISGNKNVLRELSVGDSFEVIETFEVIASQGKASIVRTCRGFVFILPNDLLVFRASDLARSPDGYSESKIALATFPVAHVVCHRTLMVNRPGGRGKGDDEYITTFVGDYQASPHFMRYSGLTGACINCVSIGNLVGQAIRGIPFDYRAQRFSFETNWSNGEVVQRGTGSNYGEDAFLRPGFRLTSLIDYLFSRVSEHEEIGADTSAILTRDWKVKLAAAIVPRGLEGNALFLKTVSDEFEVILGHKLENEVATIVGSEELSTATITAISKTTSSVVARAQQHDTRRESVDLGEFSLPETFNDEIGKTIRAIAAVAQALVAILEFADFLRKSDRRVSSELFHQPKPVDSVVDRCSVQCQVLLIGLTRATCIAATMIFLVFSDRPSAKFAAILLGILNVRFAFVTMTQGARYRNLNDENRRRIIECKLGGILKTLYSLIPQHLRGSVTEYDNPYYSEMNRLAKKFICNARYYDMDDDAVNSFENEFDRVKESNYAEATSTAFMHKLVQDLIPKTFQANSYLQDDLVNLFKSTEEFTKLSPDNDVADALIVFRLSIALKGVAAESLPSSDVNYGYMKNLAWSETAVPVTICFALQSLLREVGVSNKTHAVLKAAVSLRQSLRDEARLNRSVRDLTDLHHATNESSVGSVIYLSSGALVIFSFFSSLLLLVDFLSENQGSFLSPTQLSNVALWLCVGCAPGLLISFASYAHILSRLIALDVCLGTSETKMLLLQIRTATKAHEFLVAIRLLMVLLLAVSLLSSVAIVHIRTLFFPDDFFIYLAAATAVSWLIVDVLAWAIELSFFYNLDSCAGDVVFKSFQSRIEESRNEFLALDGSDVETRRSREVDSLEYAAREFIHFCRFDMLLDADRFGSILHRLQSENEIPFTSAH